MTQVISSANPRLIQLDYQPGHSSGRPWLVKDMATILQSEYRCYTRIQVWLVIRRIMDAMMEGYEEKKKQAAEPEAT